MFGFWKKKTPQPALSDEQKRLLRVQLKLFRDTAQDWRAKEYDLRRADHQAEVWASLASAVAAFRETRGYQAFVDGSRMQELFTYSTTNPREFSARLGLVAGCKSRIQRGCCLRTAPGKLLLSGQAMTQLISIRYGAREGGRGTGPSTSAHFNGY